MSQRNSIANPFTVRQRRGLMVLCAVILVVNAISLLRKKSFVADPVPSEGDRAVELKDWIDPNTASASEFAVLPALGERRAMDLVEFRERVLRLDPTRVVFQRPQDLMQVRGIGVAILEQLKPYLRFPATPSSQPAR